MARGSFGYRYQTIWISLVTPSYFVLVTKSSSWSNFKGTSKRKKNILSQVPDNLEFSCNEGENRVQGGYYADITEEARCQVLVPTHFESVDIITSDIKSKKKTFRL